MTQNFQIWQNWAEILDRWGIKYLTATVLEAMGPLNMLGAQIVYVGQPFFSPFFPKGNLNVLADLLEDPQKTQAFITILRQSDQPESV